MEINLDEYLKAEKVKLENEKLRLDVIGNDRSSNGEIQFENESRSINQNIRLKEKSLEHQLACKPHKDCKNGGSNIDLSRPAIDLLQLGNEVISYSNPHSVSDDGTHYSKMHDYNRIKKAAVVPKASADFSDSSNVESDSNLSKVLKECLNARRSGETSLQKLQNGPMEECVSDTFYSYFPSMNVLNKKRENLAKDRQQDYQNHLKWIAASESKPKRNPLKHKEIKFAHEIAKNDKSESEVIVSNFRDNNSNYNNCDGISRPASTKLKLLQDLKHTALSNIVNGDGVLDRNRIIAENENKKKVEYKKQLLIQIEEKRKEIQSLKEKDKLEEELLTKKLEDQLKSMQLEDEREKERIKVEKPHISNERTQEMRMELLSKLGTDKQLLKKHEIQSQIEKESIYNNDNKVYKYFSNSARHNEYNKYGRQQFFDAYESDESQLAVEKNFPSIILTSNSSCSSCNGNFKNSACNNCEEKLSNYSMSCESCKEQFLMCPSCETSNTHCLFFHRRQSACSYCIRNVCLYCGNLKRNPSPLIKCRGLSNDSSRRSKSGSIRSFKVLDISYEESDDDGCQHGNYKIPSRNKKPNSMNIEKTSIIHPEMKGIEAKSEINIRTGKVVNHLPGDNNSDTYISGQNTNERLSRYLRNYGDLSGRTSKGLQTSSDNEGGDSSISIPLLRQLPKVNATKTTEDTISAKPENYQMKQTVQKWEIPAAQKNTVSSSSPRVLTQLGAIRKQLQMENFEFDITKTGP